jgi:hypothetical protein
MATVMRDRTTIVIAHRPGTIALADTVLLLDGGRVAAQGTHAELLATSDAYRDVLAAWASAEDDDLMADASEDIDIDDPMAVRVADPREPAAVTPAQIRQTYPLPTDDLEVGTQVHEPIGGE